MKTMKQTKLWLTMLLVGSTMAFLSCSSDDDNGGGATALNVSSIIAKGSDLSSGEPKQVDLNASTSGSDVPLDAEIEIAFSKSVDASTATTGNINLTTGSDVVDADISASGNTVILTPKEELKRGTDYTLNISNSVTAEDGGKINALTRTFKTAGRSEFDPPRAENLVAYWSFDGHAMDAVGDYDADTEIEIEYQTDRFGAMNSAAYFDGDVSIIEVENAGSLLTETESLTVSFWVKTDSEGHVNDTGDPTGMFVFGLGAANGIQYEIFGSYDGSKFATSYVNADEQNLIEDMWFPSEATDNTTGGWQGWDFAKNISIENMQNYLKDNWLHVIFTYNAEAKKASLFFNGELMKSYDFNLWPDGDAKQTITGVNYNDVEPEAYDDLAFGFIKSRRGTLFQNEPWGNYESPTSQHFKGWLDDFRIFHAPFTSENAKTLYDAEKP